jgi:lysophospholipase L1-like esterase
MPEMGRRVTLPAWMGNLLLLCGSALVGLGLLEIAARVVIARRPVVTWGEQGEYSRPDPVLGWRNNPGASVRYRRSEYQTDVAINALGFRDVQHETVKAPGVTRVLALGDSFVEGYTVQLQESVTRRAEAIGRSQGCPVEVVNAGVHGYSTDQEALWFVREAEPLGPDVVIVFVYYNDILHNIRVRYWGSPKPLTRVIDGQIVPTNLPLPVRSLAARSPGVTEKTVRPVDGSRLRHLLVERMLIGAPRLYDWLGRAGLFEPMGREGIPDELRVYRARGKIPEIEEAWANTRAILGVLGDTVRMRHGRPVLVHIPARFEISDRAWALTAMRYGIDPSAWDQTLVRKHLQEIASSTGWAFLDLTPALQAAVGFPGGEPYLPEDGHWNRRGHDVAAQAVVEFLRERSLLPCGAVHP